jgi:ankyrin repeat protein
MERILSAKILKYIDNINVPDEWDLTPMHYLLLFNDDMPETVTLLLRRGADLLMRSSHIGATPFQLLMRGSNVASSMALLASAGSGTARSVDFMTQAMVGGYADFDKVDRALQDRLQTLKQREAEKREQLRTEFNARYKVGTNYLNVSYLPIHTDLLTFNFISNKQS